MLQYILLQFLAFLFMLVSNTFYILHEMSMQPKTQRRTQECFVLFFTVLFSSVFSCVCAYFVYFCVFSCVFQYIAFHLIVCIPLHHCAMSTRFRNAFQPIVFALQFILFLHCNSYCFASQFILFLHCNSYCFCITFQCNI